MLFPVSIPSFSLLDTRVIFPFLLPYYLALRNIYIRWFSENLYAQIHSPSFWQTHTCARTCKRSIRGSPTRPYQKGSWQVIGFMHEKYNSLTLCLLIDYYNVFVLCWFFSKSTFSKNTFRNIIRVSISLDPDVTWHFVGPDLGSNCLQRLSVDDTTVRTRFPWTSVFFFKIS